VKIFIKGENQTFEAVTNDAGRYKITGLPPGSYEAFPELPANLGATSSHDVEDRFGGYSGHGTVTLSDRACAKLDFTARFNGVVSGRVTDVKGEPVKDVRLNLVPVDNPGNESSVQSDEEGNYEFHLVQPGKYLLGLNLTWVPNKDNPYPRTFYPGAKDKAGAALIVVGEAEKLRGYDLTLPPRVIDRELKIAVVWPDGRPAVGADVTYKMEAEEVSLGETETTDEKGMVTIRLFDNHSYIIFAQAEPNLDKYVHAEPIRILGAKKMKPLRFVLSKPGWAYEDVEKLSGKDK
jgi:hypothetical protein